VAERPGTSRNPINQETGRTSPSLGPHRYARLSPSLAGNGLLENGKGTGVLFFGWGCFEAMRSIEIKPGGSLQTVVARERHSPRRIVCKRDGWVTPSRRTGIRASERSRARVSFDVLQKSKSWVWHRGSAGTVKSGAGVHGCLDRCRPLRPTSVANVAIEGTQGTVIVAAKPRRDSSSLVENRKEPHRRGVGPRSGVERKLTPMEGAMGRGRGGPSRVLRRSGLGFVKRSLAST